MTETAAECLALPAPLDAAEDTERTEPADRIQTFEAARRRLFALAYRMLANRADAEDVVQDTFMRWFAADVEALQVPIAWLTTVATRLAIDRMRRDQVLRVVPGEAADVLLEHQAEVAPSPEDLALAQSELRAAVSLMLQRLSRDEFTAWVLREAFDTDYAALAQRLGRSPEHCRQILHRARTRLHAGAPRGIGALELREALLEPVLQAIATQDVELLMATTGFGQLPTAAQAAGVSAARHEVRAWLTTALLMARLRRAVLPVQAEALCGVCMTS